MTKLWLSLTAPILSISIVCGLVACGGSKSDISGALPPPGGGIGVPYGVQSGFVAEKGNPYGYNAGSLSLTSSWRNVLKKAMGVCDREHSTGGYADCTTWMNGHNRVAVVFNGSTANSARLYIYSQSFSNYWYQLPSWSQILLGAVGYGSYNPWGFHPWLDLETTVWPINKSKGFELRAYAPADSFANNQLFQFQVAEGKIESSGFTFKLLLNSTVVASGQMYRCLTQDCTGN